MHETKPSKFPLPLRLTVYAVAIGLAIGAMVLAAQPSRRADAQYACRQNLMQINAAQVSVALSEKKLETEKADSRQVGQFLKSGALPKCPSGGTYELHRLKDKPTCTLAHTHGHTL